jgi:two-component system, OmpR family, response regulator
MKSTDTKMANRKKVLIIEDEGDMCLLMNIILNDEQMELDHVKSLSGAATYLQSEKPDIVLLDNKLPDGFGVDFVSVIKKVSPATRIIMITGYDPSAGDVAIENGADVFLTKPFTKDQLKASVSKFIN